MEETKKELHEEHVHHEMHHGYPEKKKDGDTLWDIVKFALTALIIVLPIRMFIAQPFIVSGASMVPTFKDKDYLIIDELTYRVEDPKRGDVIVFHPPQDTKVYYIKRIIGLPNETIVIKGSSVTIKNEEHPLGFALSEPYLQNKSNDDMTKKTGPNEYFVLGDNRPFSSDSRVWGVLPKDHITGRALLRLFPIQHIDVLPGKASY